MSPSGLRLQAFFLGCPSTSEDWPRDLLSVREAEVFLGLYVGFGAVCCGVSALIFAHSTQRVSPAGCVAAENAKFCVSRHDDFHEFLFFLAKGAGRWSRNCSGSCSSHQRASGMGRSRRWRSCMQTCLRILLCKTMVVISETSVKDYTVYSLQIVYLFILHSSHLSLF